MTETIAALMHRGMQTVDMDDSIAAVESFLTEQGRTWAPVTDDRGSVIGAISASDLLLFHAQQRDAQTVRAWGWIGGGHRIREHDAVAPARSLGALAQSS